MNKKIKNEILHSLYMLKSIGYDYHSDIDIKNNGSNTLDLPEDLTSIDNIINNCNLCNLSKLKAKENKNIYNINSNIVFISINPLNEYKLFEKMLTNVLNININDISLISILKCNTNNNELNLEKEINTCKDYLIKELELINPKLIISLGNSYKYLLNNKKELLTIRGTILKYDNINLMPIYHPDILERNPSLKKITFEDLKKIKLLMENI